MFNPNQLMYDLGFGAVEGAGKLAVQAVRGIVSAFRSKGATREEVKTLVAPLARTMQYGARQPRYLRADGGLMIEHIEAMSVNSNVNSYVVDTNLFPWLRNIANNFEEYQIQLMFAWNPTCPATTTGQVWMAYDYDPEDSDTSYLQVQDYFNTADHCISAIWAPAVINPKQSGWLKTGNNGTPRLYSPGKLYLSTTDTAQGFLTVKYRIHLRKPQPSFPASDAFFSGSLTNPITPFASRSAVYGDASLSQPYEHTVHCASIVRHEDSGVLLQWHCTWYCNYFHQRDPTRGAF